MKVSVAGAKSRTISISKLKDIFGGWDPEGIVAVWQIEVYNTWYVTNVEAIW